MKNTTMNALKFMDRWGNWGCLGRAGMASLLVGYGKAVTKVRKRQRIPTCYECREGGVDCMGGGYRGTAVCRRLRMGHGGRAK